MTAALFDGCAPAAQPYRPPATNTHGGPNLTSGPDGHPTAPDCQPGSSASSSADSNSQGRAGQTSHSQSTAVDYQPCPIARCSAESNSPGPAEQGSHSQSTASDCQPSSSASSRTDSSGPAGQGSQSQSTAAGCQPSPTASSSADSDSQGPAGQGSHSQLNNAASCRDNTASSRYQHDIPCTQPDSAAARTSQRSKSCGSGSEHQACSDEEEEITGGECESAVDRAACMAMSHRPSSFDSAHSGRHSSEADSSMAVHQDAVLQTQQAASSQQYQQQLQAMPLTEAGNSEKCQAQQSLPPSEARQDNTQTSVGLSPSSPQGFQQAVRSQPASAGNHTQQFQAACATRTSLCGLPGTGSEGHAHEALQRPSDISDSCSGTALVVETECDDDSPADTQTVLNQVCTTLQLQTRLHKLRQVLDACSVSASLRELLMDDAVTYAYEADTALPILSGMVADWG